MTDHLYRVGETVNLSPHSGTFLKTPGVYTVRAQLPPSAGALQYRIRCASEPYERVVAEHQLLPVTEAQGAVAEPATALK